MKSMLSCDVQWLSFDELDERAAEFDALVEGSERLDRFCSSTYWVLPARRAFTPQAQPYLRVEAEAAIALKLLPAQTGHRIAVPLEAGWGLAAPYAGSPTVAAQMLAEMVEEAAPDAMFLSGVERDGPLMRGLIALMMSRYRIGVGPACPRRVASLEGGFEGFLHRRSAKFRQNLRREGRRAVEAGLTYEYFDAVAQPEAFFDRLMAVESRSWKGQAGEGVDRGPPRQFYREITRRLAADGRLRALLISRDGEDLAYVFGGVLGDTYRGLQVSFDGRIRAYGGGNLAQAEMVRRLCEEGVGIYDLGTDMPYKHRWAEAGLETITLALLPR